MADSNPPKRRRISPSAEIPNDAPGSPGKSERPRSQDGTRSGSAPRRPSFASPTKSSLAKLHPQIQHQIGQSGPQNPNANPRATDVKAPIENATGSVETAGGQLGVAQTPNQEDHGDLRARHGQGNSQTPSQVQSQGVRPVTGFMAAPRRRSRTPGKVPLQSNFDPARNVPEVRGGGQAPSNTFGAVTGGELSAEPIIRRSALRRSPVGSPSQTESQISQPPHFSPTEGPAANIGIVRRPPTAGTSQSLSRSAEKIESGPGPGPVRKPALRRSPPVVSSQIGILAPSQPESNQHPVELEARPEDETVPPQHTPRHHKHSDILGRDQEQDDEPELPPTPVQRGLEDPVVTTPPTGIHDTPSKRKSKKQDPLMAKEASIHAVPARSSPLKPQSKVQSQSRAFSASMAPKPLSKPYRAGSAQIDFLAEGAHVQRADGDVEMTGVSRHGPRPPPDAHAAKRKLRDKLLLELQKLQADVSMAELENERLHSLHESGHGIEAAAPNRYEIEQLLIRAGYGNEEDGQDVTQEKQMKPLSPFHALSSFLPFSAPLERQPAPKTDEESELMPSHLPQKQENPLPYLQLFTPLEFSSIITVLPSSSDPDISIVSTSTSSSTEVLKDIIQSHVITARSPKSISIFRSTVSILVNTTTFSIMSIKIDSLSPAAEPELGKFVRRISGADNDDILAGNVATLFWAMGRWYEVAWKRAMFWARVVEEFGPKSDFAARLRRNHGKGERAIQKKGGRRGKSARNDDQDDGDDEGSDSEEANVANDREDESYEKKLTRKQCLSNMGRQSTILSIPIPSSTNTTLSFRLEWKISFDWTGETENSISIGVLSGKAGGWPATWRNSDTRNSLAKIPGTFERMVRERGPLRAVRGVVALVAGGDW